MTRPTPARAPEKVWLAFHTKTGKPTNMVMYTELDRDAFRDVTHPEAFYLEEYVLAPCGARHTFHDGDTYACGLKQGHRGRHESYGPKGSASWEPKPKKRGGRK